MARMLKILGISLLASPLIGCVPAEKYNALKLHDDAVSLQLSQAESAEKAAEARSGVLETQMQQFANAGDNKGALLINLQNQNQDLLKQVEDLTKKYDDAVNKIGAAAPLPPELSNALSAFASENPDMVDFDSAKGTVKFKSDVTFSSGSAMVTPAATTVITRFASILNTPAAAGYELMVVGHTDNQPVSNPATYKAGHKDNWYLSVHRAIAVSEILRRDEVSPSRLEVAGFADQRPIADNSSAAGRSQNRRVEVLILPTKVTASAPSEAVPAGNHIAPAAQPPARASFDNKQ